MLLAADGHVRLTDFGVAVELALFGGPDPLPGGGSPAFSSPELAAGQAAGYPADIWAAGVTLWNLTTGTYPFEVEARAAVRNTAG